MTSQPSKSDFAGEPGSEVSSESPAAPRGERADLNVFISHRESVCGECKDDLGSGRWIFLAGERSALCLECADLDHLEFLPPGDAALTRRARKYSRVCAVVLKFSRARKRYERQGLLIEAAALARAESECLQDADLRERRRLREADRRLELDSQFVAEFARCIRAQYPGCPENRDQEIAEHACRKHSGRVGRSAAAKDFDEQAIRLAVIAHIRHAETNYDELLGTSWDRDDARQEVASRVNEVLRTWSA